MRCQSRSQGFLTKWLRCERGEKAFLGRGEKRGADFIPPCESQMHTTKKWNIFPIPVNNFFTILCTRTSLRGINLPAVSCHNVFLSMCQMNSEHSWHHLLSLLSKDRGQRHNHGGTQVANLQHYSFAGGKKTLTPYTVYIYYIIIRWITLQMHRFLFQTFIITDSKREGQGRKREQEQTVTQVKSHIQICHYSCF